MIQPTITVANCDFPPGSNQPQCAQGDGALCAGGGGADACSGGTEPGATCVSLAIVPSSGFCEVGGTWQFKAVAKFSDGTCDDVTASCVWDTSLPSVATVDQTGLATAVSGGQATISADYGTCSGFAVLEVALACHDIGTDICLVLPRDSGMLLTAQGQTRLSYVAQGASQLISGMDTAKDQIAVISYAGVVYEGGTNTQGDATIDCALTNSQAALAAAIADYDVRGPCFFPDENAGPNTRCAVGLGSALQAALQVITGPGHTPGAKQLIVICVDGRDRVGTPDPAVVAAQIAAAHVNLMIVAIDVSLDYSATLASYATPGMFFGFFGNEGDIPTALAGAAFVQCSGFYPYALGNAYGYGNPAPSNPGDPGGIAANMEGLRWELACGATAFPNAWACWCAANQKQQTTLKGDPTQTYNVTLRFRGVVEANSNYVNGTADGYFYVGGNRGADRAKTNIYFLKVTPPGSESELGVIFPVAGVTYQSRWFFLNYAETEPGASDNIGAIDYTKTIAMKGNSTVMLYADSGGDGGEVANWKNIVVPGVRPAPSAFNGQFIQMDVVSVA
jgi:hypothetical protein